MKQIKFSGELMELAGATVTDAIAIYGAENVEIVIQITPKKVVVPQETKGTEGNAPKKKRGRPRKVGRPRKRKKSSRFTHHEKQMVRRAYKEYAGNGKQIPGQVMDYLVKALSRDRTQIAQKAYQMGCTK